MIDNEQVKAMRQAAGLSLIAFAAEVGISVKIIRNIESGKRKIKDDEDLKFKRFAIINGYYQGSSMFKRPTESSRRFYKE